MNELIPKGDTPSGTPRSCEALVSLLTRLAELDPALCQLGQGPAPRQALRSVVPRVAGDNMFTLAGKGICADFFPHFPRVYTDERELVLAWIQYAVQQAIVARGWGYEIHSNRFVENNGPKVRCHIEKNTGLVYDNAFYFTPAEALLSAYVRALEAEAG